MKVILASSSPRRGELLENAGVRFSVVSSPAEEIHDAGLGMAGLCETNAALKALPVAVDHPDAVVIGADTLVFIDGDPLGKPRDMAEAREMLRRLSGRTHQVCTGVCLAGPGDATKLLHEITDVVFRELDEAAIEEYLSQTHPLDKAGAYGIQDHGEKIIEKIAGSYENVMGLPVMRVVRALEENGLPVAGR
jgi:septum formation protein